MKHMTSGEIRQAFLDYFEAQGHEVVASSSVVPGNDPTLLFANAGMVQFKDVFLGVDDRPYTRATTAQKCMRVSGKQNDLEEVGPSPRHHTFFEMLGNFSFGDYFKEDAIRFAWEFVTETLGLPAERLAVTIYETDDDSFDLWHEMIGIPKHRIVRLGASENFWQMAETGPCGPNTEIHWDRYPERGDEGITESFETDDGRFLEIWNLVFMEFNRTAPDPEHTGEFDQPLPQPGVDTGMGLERVASVMQEVETNYDTDLFTDIMDATQEILGHDDAAREEHHIAYRVIADHGRAASFLIADGVIPGNKGREYVTRMLIRRAMRFAHRMGVERPFLNEVAKAVIAKMGEAYPELKQRREAIQRYIATEEERFLQTLDNALGELEARIEEMKANNQVMMSGQDAFFLFSTHGLPLEITRDVLQEHDMTVNQAEFDEARQRHAEESGVIAQEITDQSIYATLLAGLKNSDKLGSEGVTYDPYGPMELETEVVALLVDDEPVGRVEYSLDQEIQVVLAATSFYVESGGQVSDTGVLVNEDWEVEVTGMAQPVGGLVVHIGRITYGDAIHVGDKATAIVNHHRRGDIQRNHTATHLLHAALREILGDHVQQRGSLVAPDRLRFDFSHGQALTADELDMIRTQINEIILSNIDVGVAYKSLDEAKSEGAMALFGQKYGQTVRTVRVGNPVSGDARWSYELCGGTHVRSTGAIGTFIITNETSSAAGIRRIEAVTGHIAQDMIQEQTQTLNDISNRLRTDPTAINERLDDLMAQLDEAQAAIDRMQRESAKSDLNNLLDNIQEIEGVNVLAAQVEVSDGDLLGEMVDWCRDRLDSGLIVLGASFEGKGRLTAAATDDVIERGLTASDVVKAAAKRVGGGGGGRPNFANAGIAGDKVANAIASIPEIVADHLA